MKLSEELQRKIEIRDILKTYEIEDALVKVKELENLFETCQKDHLLTLKDLKEAELEVSALHKTIQSWDFILDRALELQRKYESGDFFDFRSPEEVVNYILGDWKKENP